MLRPTTLLRDHRDHRSRLCVTVADKERPLLCTTIIRMHLYKISLFMLLNVYGVFRTSLFLLLCREAKRLYN